MPRGERVAFLSPRASPCSSLCHPLLCAMSHGSRPMRLSCGTPAAVSKNRSAVTARTTADGEHGSAALVSRYSVKAVAFRGNPFSSTRSPPVPEGPPSSHVPPQCGRPEVRSHPSQRCGRIPRRFGARDYVCIHDFQQIDGRTCPILLQSPRSRMPFPNPYASQLLRLSA